MNTMKWLLKREYWEHKGGFFWAPAVVSGVIALFTIGSMLITMIFGSKNGFNINNNHGMNLQDMLGQISEPDKIEFANSLATAYPAIAMPLLIVMTFVIFFYCLGNLFDDRKDRSILFWKSLPISDQNTVISKALTALVVAPVISITFAMALSLFLLFSLLIAAAIMGVNLFGLVLGNGHFYLVFIQIVSFIPIYALWALPTVGYLMFVSAWAKTKPFLWAVGVPVMGGVIISWMNAIFSAGFDLSKYWQVIVGRGLGSILPGSWLAHMSEEKMSAHSENAMSALLSNTYQLLGTADLWIGVIIGLAFLFAAVKMRRYRDEG
jgi:ABC-2 type transport system permease protein